MQGVPGEQPAAAHGYCAFSRHRPLNAAEVTASDSYKDDKFEEEKKKLTTSKPSGYRPKGFTTSDLAYVVKTPQN